MKAQRCLVVLLVISFGGWALAFTEGWREPNSRTVAPFPPLLDQIRRDDEVILVQQPERPADLWALPGGGIDRETDVWTLGGGVSALVVVRAEETRTVLVEEGTRIATISTCVVERVAPLVHRTRIAVGDRLELGNYGGDLMVGNTLLRDNPSPWRRRIERGRRYVSWVPSAMKKDVPVQATFLEVSPEDRLVDMISAPMGADWTQALTGRTVEWLFSLARAAVAKVGGPRQPAPDQTGAVLTPVQDRRATEARHRTLRRGGPLALRLRADDDVIEVVDSRPPVRLISQPVLRPRDDVRGSGVLDFAANLPGLTLAVVAVETSAPVATDEGAWIEWRTAARVATPIVGGWRTGQRIVVTETGGELRLGKVIVRAGNARMLEPFLPGRRYLLLSYRAHGCQAVHEAWYIDPDNGTLSYISADGVGGRPWQEALSRYSLQEVVEAFSRQRSLRRAVGC
jgi:hypothetical protein